MNEGHTGDCVRARVRAWAHNQAPLPPCHCLEDKAAADALAAALHNAVAALNTNSFHRRSLALQDLAREVTRLLGLEWNPYGQTTAPDGTITSRDEDIRP